VKKLSVLSDMLLLPPATLASEVDSKMCSALEEEERKERVDRATNIPWRS
jgi:hypothetical protein